MLRLVALLLLLLGQTAFGEAPVREIAGGRPFGTDPLPVLDRGYLFFISRSSSWLTGYDPNGQIAVDVAVQGPPGTDLRISDAAIDTDGTLVAAAGYSGAPHGYGGALVFLDRSGNQVRFVPTDRYMPAGVCFAPDHSVWTVGWQRDLEDNRIEDRQDHMLIRRYSTDGRQTGAFVSRSVFPRGLAPGAGGLGRWRIRAAADRVGALVFPGSVADKPEWVEMDLNGKLIGRWPLGHDPVGLAFTSGGRLFKRTMIIPERGRPPALQLSVFDRASAGWVALDDFRLPGEPEEKSGLLLGADGDHLVFARRNGLILIWATAPH